MVFHRAMYGQGGGKTARRTRKIAYKLKGMATRTMAGKALKMARYLVKQNNAEHKVFDYSSSGYISATTTAIGYEVFNPSQGSAYNQRVGDTCKINSMNLRFVATLNPSGATTQLFRLLLVKIRDANGFSTLIGNILQNTGTNAIDQIVSPKNYDKRFDTKILLDKHISLVKASDKESVQLRYTFKNLGHTKFIQGTNQVENSRYILYIMSDQIDNVPFIDFNVRTTFVDN